MAPVFCRQIASNLAIGHDISQRTIERALKELQETGKIGQVGSGRSTKYIKI